MRELVMIGGVVMALLASCGGGSDAEKACDHMAALKKAKSGADPEREKQFKERCVTELNRDLPKCKDKGKAFVECILKLKAGEDKDTREELCEEKCER